MSRYNRDPRRACWLETLNMQLIHRQFRTEQNRIRPTLCGINLVAFYTRPVFTQDTLESLDSASLSVSSHTLHNPSNQQTRTKKRVNLIVLKGKDRIVPHSVHTSTKQANQVRCIDMLSTV